MIAVPDRKFDIEFSYQGPPEFASAFEEAAEGWEKIIVADLPDVRQVDDLLINATVASIDGRGGTLGQAGPTGLRKDSGLPYKGVMRFDEADIEGMFTAGTLTSTVMHEMGHALGLGSLWDRFDFIDRANAGYTGENALTQYRALSGDTGASFVPLETTGGRGTAYSHWSEGVFGDEIMTGYADREMPVSRMTIGALEDLGYTVRYAAADPFSL